MGRSHANLRAREHSEGRCPVAECLLWGRPGAAALPTQTARFGTTTEREPGTGDIVTRDPNGRVVQRIPADQAQKPSK
jgi:hypothetical protein